jgi:hypothetical protein
MPAMLYGFRIHSIQNLVFRSNTLREISKGSALVDELPSNVFREFLEKCGVKDVQILQAAAGTLICAGGRDGVETIAKFWPVAVEAHAPGITFTQGTLDTPAVTSDAITQLEQKLEIARLKPQLRENHTPVSRMDMITGNAAVLMGEKSEPRDRLYQRLKNVDREFEQKIDGLADKKHPNVLEELDDDLKRMAIVHCDTNGLGKLKQEVLQAAGNGAAATLMKLSEGLNELAKKSYGRAWTKTFASFEASDKKPIPAKILILGGDDISYAIHPAYALRFTLAYLNEFELESAQLMQNLGVKGAGKLTARAGVLVTKTGFPIYRGLEMAESLANRGKSLFVAGPVTHSTVSFYRLRDTVDEKEFDQVRAFALDQELQGRVSAQTMLKLVDKFLEAEISLARLKSWLDESDKNEIKLGWERFRQMHESESRRGKEKADRARDFFAAFEQVGGHKVDESGERPVAADLSEWASVMRISVEQQ